MIVEFRHGLDTVQLDANELMKLMEFVVQYVPKDCTRCVRDEFEQIVVETSDAKITRLCLDYDLNEKEATT